MIKIIFKNNKGDVIYVRDIDIETQTQIHDGNFVKYLIKLFKFNFNIDVSEYTFSDIHVNDDEININIKNRDIDKIRSFKINEII
jgi:hypothetical protein